MPLELTQYSTLFTPLLLFSISFLSFFSTCVIDNGIFYDHGWDGLYLSGFLTGVQHMYHQCINHQCLIIVLLHALDFLFGHSDSNTGHFLHQRSILDTLSSLLQSSSVCSTSCQVLGISKSFSRPDFSSL